MLQRSPVITANRAVAVAMSQGAAAGLALLDELQPPPLERELIAERIAALTS